MTVTYPWYNPVEGPQLEQGDILFHCPVIVPAFDFPLKSQDEIDGDIHEFDLIVMTQSCDLALEKVQDVILCPHFDIFQAGTMDSDLAKKGALSPILKGYRPRYTMLAASEIEEYPMNVRIVDFGRIFSLPKSFVSAFAKSQGKRLRLCPPYREHLAQAFARFFMRVGLPQNIELPKDLTP